MKRLSLYFALSASLLVAYAQPAGPVWPINPKTGAVVFTGSAKWPAAAKTEAQRRAWVRAWYLKWLTDYPAADVDADVADSRRVKSLVSVTYPEVLRACTIRADSAMLSYNYDAQPTPTGISYRLSDFHYTAADGQQYTVPVALKQKRHQQALAAFRKRLSDAEAALR